MHSIKTKITAMTVCVIVIAMAIATVLGVTAIRDIGNHDAEQTFGASSGRSVEFIIRCHFPLVLKRHF